MYSSLPMHPLFYNSLPNTSIYPVRSVVLSLGSKTFGLLENKEH